MADVLVHSESPVEFFRDLVESSLQRQHLSAREGTSFYLVNLLAGFAHADRFFQDDKPLGVRFVRALHEAGTHQRNELRDVGDRSLFISGFFGDSLARGPVDVDYYIQLGESAYGSLARRSDGFAEVFDELAAKFPFFVDVLNEVSERTGLASNADLLRLYEKWLRTRSPRSGDLLTSRGIVPNASIGSRFLQ